MLIDSFGRTINYIRLSVTEHCNYHCFYCREEDHKVWSKKQDILSFEEIGRIISIFAKLGVNKVRLTGGEPLLRKDIDKLAKILHNIPNIDEIPLSTNAHLLDIWAEKLYQNGVKQVNISLDSIQKERFNTITRGGDLSKVLAGIRVAKQVGMKIKINMVVMDGNNTNEIIPMLEFAMQNGLELRYIETMPIGIAGIDATKNHYSKAKILSTIEKKFYNIKEIPSKKNSGPATMYEIGDNKFGIISAISDEFCISCNRLRITTAGKLILCLGQENSLNLKELLTTKTNAEIEKLIVQAVNKKPEKHYFNNDVNNVETRQMVEIGG
jgi:cyclic pyranopterin phosphate synthase